MTNLAPTQHPRSPAESVRAVTFRAMNTRVTLQVVGSGPKVDAALTAAEEVFRRVEKACTRFDPSSPLMRANEAKDTWFSVPPECHQALTEAARAHQETEGLFDPRVLESLVGLGYDRTLPFRSQAVELSARPSTRGATLTVGSWKPGLEAGRVKVGPSPIDLGGIGKGFAVRLAGEVLGRAVRAHVVEAGGDCHLGGNGPRDEGWQVGVEDPRGGDRPVAVLKLRDTGCATSSLKVRNWRVGQEQVHHLIDPRTGTSAQGGVLSVTVVGPDTARDEVWAKSLLIAGKREISSLSNAHGLAALWVDDEGQVSMSSAMQPWVSWLPSRAPPATPRTLPPHLSAALEDRTAMLALLTRLMQLEQSAKRLTFNGLVRI
jgi:thiamine biosynthesis lipoprotein